MRFLDDEDGYAAWLSANRNGFVFNHFGGRNSDMNVVHRSSCRHLHRSADVGERTRYEKICNDDLDDLLAVVNQIRVDVGGWKYCGSCLSGRAGSRADVSKRAQTAKPSISATPTKVTPRTDRPPSSPPLKSEDFTIWRPAKVLERIEIEPRLASWDAKSRPSQQRLQSYLDVVEAAFAPHLHDPNALLYLDVDVVRASNTDLLLHHDLENYLTPIAQRLRSPAIVLARGRKRHPEHPADRSLITLGHVEPGAKFENWNFQAVRMSGSASSNAWKETLRQELINSGVEQATDGPLAIVIAWHTSHRLKSWWNTWKGTGDALGPILGEPIPDKPFNPADDRIVRLEMHHDTSPNLEAGSDIGIWWQVGSQQ